MKGNDNMFKAKTKVLDAGNDKVIVESNNLSYKGKDLSQPIPYRGEVVTKLAAFWFTHLMPNNFISTNFKKIPPGLVLPPLENYMLVKSINVFPFYCKVTGFTHVFTYGVKNDYERLFEPKLEFIWSKDGYEMQFSAVEDFIGSKVAKQLKETCIRLYNEAEKISEKKEVYILNTSFKMGIDENNVIMLTGKPLNPENTLFFARSLPTSFNFFDNEYLYSYFTKKEWDSKSEAPELSNHHISLLSSIYVNLYTAITGQDYFGFY